MAKAGRGDEINVTPPGRGTNEWLHHARLKLNELAGMRGVGN